MPRALDGGVASQPLLVTNTRLSRSLSRLAISCMLPPAMQLFKTRGGDAFKQFIVTLFTRLGIHFSCSSYSLSWRDPDGYMGRFHCILHVLHVVLSSK